MNNDTTEAEAEAEALAESLMTVEDWKRMEAEGLSARDYFRKYRDADPANHNTEGGLRAAALSANEVDATDVDHEDVEDVNTDSGLSVSVGVDQRQYGDSPEEIAALSRSVMTVSDWREMEAAGLSEREYVAEQHGADPAEHRSEASLRQAIESEGGETQP